MIRVFTQPGKAALALDFTTKDAVLAKKNMAAHIPFDAALRLVNAKNTPWKEVRA